MYYTNRKPKKLQGWFHWKRLLVLFFAMSLIGVAVFAFGYDSDTPADIYGYSQYYNEIDSDYIEYYDDYMESVIGYAPEYYGSYYSSYYAYDYESHYGENYGDEYDFDIYESHAPYDSYYNYSESDGYIGIAPTSFIEVTLSGPMFFGATGLQHQIDNLPAGWTLYVRLNFLGGTFAQSIFGPGTAAQPIVIDGGQNVIIDTNVEGINMMWSRTYMVPAIAYASRHFEITNGTLEIRNVTLAGQRSGYNFNGGVLVDGENATFIMSHESVHSTPSNIVISNPRIFDTSSEVYGGGVEVRNGGSFIMHAGTIGDLCQARYGAGVSVRGVGSSGQRSSFEMRGGAVHKNQTLLSTIIADPSVLLGAGVHVSGGASFIMVDCADTPESPRIYHNRTNGRGAGVAVVGSHGNQPSTFTMYGGTIGIDMGRAPLNPTPMIWTGNMALHEGGGVYVVEGARLTMNGGYIYSNTSGVHTTSDVGGGVLPAHSRGGGVYVSGANSRFYMNSGFIGYPTTAGAPRANGAARGGGVAVNNGARFYLSGGSIWHNANQNHVSGAWHPEGLPHRNGAGVHVDNSSTLTMTGGYISHNASYQSGGGVYVNNNSTFTMSNGNIRNNSATTEGGGVKLTSDSVFNMSGGTIGGAYTPPALSSAANTAVRGGGVAVYDGATFTMTVPASGPGGSILGNSASGGGGVVVVGDDGDTTSFTMHSGTIGGNHGTGGTQGAANIVSGGGVLVFGAHGIFTMNNGDIRDNRTPVWSGGGVNVTNHSSFIMNGGYIQHNTAVISGGGGVSVRYDATFTMNNSSSTIRNNASILGSGVLAYNRGLFTMNNGIISSNIIHAASNGDVFGGGGIGVIANGTVYMHGGTIRDHVVNVGTGLGDGGGVWVGMVSGFESGIHLSGINRFTMTNGYIVDNEARHGGGVLVEGGDLIVGAPGALTRNHFIMTGGHIRGNEARQNGGGLHIRDNGILQMSGGTIGGTAEAHANVANINGGGVYLRDSSFTMYDGHIRNNAAYEDGGGVWVHMDASFTAYDGHITHNEAGRMGGGIFTENHEYACPLPTNRIPPPAGIAVGAQIAYSNLTLQGVTFENNKANQIWWPPENRGALTHLGFATTSQPSHIPTSIRHPLNNYDINFRVPVLRYDFFKTDSGIYRQSDPTINLLANAQFRLFRNTNPELSPPMGTGPDYLVTLPLGPGWEEVSFVNNIYTSPGAGSTTPLGFYIDPRHTYQLMEIVPPAGFQMPMGQWRITVTSGNINNTIIIGGTPMPGMIRSTDLPAIANHPISPRNNLFYVGNWDAFELPMTGGSGMNMVVLSGTLLFGVVAVLMVFAVVAAKKKAVISTPYKHSYQK
ncbi:MAG: hypothetical protein FWC73_06465 [Defluviitaleaceae bacterium]|nr:hypothetical protein [Defluviitaleaceae bacterium]